jgi:4-hydroxythreonine-4-phosphate dehydrogenase
MDEIEPGVPLGLTMGARRIPVVTKAGGFGDALTLERCLARLKN